VTGSTTTDDGVLEASALSTGVSGLIGGGWPVAQPLMTVCRRRPYQRNGRLDHSKCVLFHLNLL